jgi:hypothetical protein
MDCAPVRAGPVGHREFGGHHGPGLHRPRAEVEIVDREVMGRFAVVCDLDCHGRSRRQVERFWPKRVVDRDELDRVGATGSAPDVPRPFSALV